MEKIPNGKVFIWMQLLGFDRDDPDRGAARYLDQTGFLPEGICALLFHPDFVHHHRGMDEEYGLHPDNCAYWGIPKNRERERQPWTNHDLKKLVSELAARGVGFYAGIMGSVTGNAFHREWISDHGELLGCFALKRFKDGSWYEDFFVDQLCKTLKDYGMRGVHLADGFCPSGNIYQGDYSTDMVTQFTDHTKTALPSEITAKLGDDSAEPRNARQGWIWKNARAEWIEFMCWRWEKFFSKLCSRVHEIGCEVMTLGMYCTDPFETKYCLGMDLGRVMEAGVDYLTANILPTSCYIANPWGSAEYFFHRYMAIAPTTAAHIKSGHLISMLGVQDATEEWDAMKHMPCWHERDLYTMMAYNAVDKNGPRRALEGYFLCLGDGISRADWDIERTKLEVALSADVDAVLSPCMLWSEAAYEKMLDEYIQTRRWTPFKLFYELGKAGVMCGACITSDALENHQGTLLVPDFDMLSHEEKQSVAGYKNGAVICTAPAGFDPAPYGIQSEICFADRHSSHPLCAFLFGAPVSAETAKKIEALLASDDGAPDVEDPDGLADFTYTLIDTLPFVKVGSGFRDAVALLLKEANREIVCDMPYLACRLKNGAWRLYVFNNVNHQYRHAFVKIGRPVADVKIVSGFPVLPVRYMSQKDGGLVHNYDKEIPERQNFEVKLLPGGVTVLDVFFE